MKKILLSALFAVFAAEAAFAQDGVQNGTQNNEQNRANSTASGVLKRSGFAKFTVGDQAFRLCEVDKYIDDFQTANRIRKGIRLEKAAIGLGVSGAVFLGVGMGCWMGGGFSAFFDFMQGRDTTQSDNIAAAGLAMTIIGGAAGVTSIALGATGASMTKKAVRGYNAGRLAEMRLGLAATPGGLGMQLTF